jgi:hypothetical protein
VSNRIRLLFTVAAGVALLGLASGCGGNPTAKVSGTVTLDGQPLENGTITFYPTANSGQTAGGGIENGKYTLDASPGEMTVLISANKVTGKHKMYDTPDSPTVDTVVELIPARYNKTSELKVTLKPGVNEGVNFDLTTKKK